MTIDRKHMRGFASLSPERRREIASKGGKAVHASGKGHQWTREEARAAGRLGGLATHRAQGPRQRPLLEEAA